MSYMITVHHIGRMMFCYLPEPSPDFRSTMIRRQQCASELYENLANKYGKHLLKLDTKHDFNPHVPITIWYRGIKEYEIYIMQWPKTSGGNHSDYVTQPHKK
jgi:hypothetical protein